jgi:uncharacterized protein YndB with AHSA1/START domain
MLKTILIVVAVAIAAVLIYAATRPDSFRVERSLQVNAPPEKVFALINSLSAWRSWSPWEKKDPAMQRSLTGPESGVGAAYGWKGNKNVGEGKMEIIESVPASRIRIKLDFVTPFEAHNQVEFTLTPAGGGTRVVWAMSGPSPYISKLIGVFMNFDKMIGNDFEAGLANLKVAAET